jgi:hypothetical protein
MSGFVGVIAPTDEGIPRAAVEQADPACREAERVGPRGCGRGGTDPERGMPVTERPAATTDRRGFLRLAGLAGATISGAGLVGVRPDRAKADANFVCDLNALPALQAVGAPRLWSDPGTWGGVMPGPNDAVEIASNVILDTDTEIAGLSVNEGASLTFASNKNVSMKSSANVVVNGTFKMHPANAHLHHTLTFTNVDESIFVGGGMDPLDTDVGLWVVGNGKLDLRGEPKLAWGRLAGGANKHDKSIKLDRAPHGWRKGDELAITPSLKPTEQLFDRAYDIVKIKSINGRTVHLTKGLDYNHPVMKLPSKKNLGTEVLNLSRNVKIQGTASGRSHVFVHSNKKPTVKYALFRYLGPRKDDLVILGRWGLHLHMMKNKSRGTHVIGSVVRDSGSHGFVAHHSHGVTFQRCIVHESIEDAFWWDHITQDLADASNDTTYDHCVASKLEGGPVDEHNLCGFKMEHGHGNAARGCIGVGILGGSNGSGFHWPEFGPHGIWDFEDCIGHNNLDYGAYTWQNDDGHHIHRDFLSYRCGKAGIGLGAYGNRVHLLGMTSLEQGDAGVHNFARTSTADKSHLLYRDLVIDGNGLTGNGIRFIDNNLAPKDPVQFFDTHFLGVGTPIYVFTTDDAIEVDFIRPVVGALERNLEPSDIDIDFAAPGTRIRVQRKNDTAWKMDENGVVTDIAPFA